MANDISAGEHFLEGELCSAQRLNDHVDDAEILPTFISTKPLKEELTTTDEFVLNDNGVLKRTTIANIMSATAVPAGVVVDYAGLTAPVGWQLCYGQTLSRTTFADLFAAIGTQYGAGDGSTTFLAPDYRDRVIVGKGDMGGTAINRITVFSTTGLGNNGGAQSIALTTAHLASHTHTGPSHTHSTPNHQHYTSAGHSHDLSNHTHSYAEAVQGGSGGLAIGANAGVATRTTGGPSYNATGVAAAGWTDSGGGSSTGAAGTGATSSVGSGTAHDNVQPSIVANKIIKV